MSNPLKISARQFNRNDWQTTVLFFIPLFGILYKSVLFFSYYYGDNYFELNVVRGIATAFPYALISLSVIAIFASFALLIDNQKRRTSYILGLNIFYTVLCLIYVCYMRYFNDVPTIKLASIISFNNEDMPTSAANIMLPLMASDILLFFDLMAMAVVHWSRDSLPVLTKTTSGYNVMRRAIPTEKTGKDKKARHYSFAAIAAVSFVCVLTVSVSGSVGGVLYADTLGSHLGKQRLTAIGPMGYFVSDVADNMFQGGAPTYGPLSVEEQQIVESWYQWNNKDYTENTYFGRAAGKNVLFIQVESLEAFVIGQSIGGQEITPNLNRILSQSYYFSNMRDQVTCGNSSDADAIYDTSMYPASNLSAFNFYSRNNYNSTPVLLGADGYESAYFNSVSDSVWDYESMIENGLRYQHSNDHGVKFKLDDMLNTYLSDDSHLKQTLSQMVSFGYAESGSKWYARTVLCSSHAPFMMPESKRKLKLVSALKHNSLGDYMQAVHYTDACIGSFLKAAQESGVLDNAIVVVTGDHRGIHKYYPYAINDLPDDVYEDWMGKNFDASVPYIVFDPSFAEGEGERFDYPIGQVDAYPTIMYLLGIAHDRYSETAMGRSGFLPPRPVVDNNGVLHGEYTEEDEQQLKNAYYVAQLIYKSNYFKGKGYGG